ncbi:hypothetical protein Cni_G06087 [Canna indica]|uniref:Uncharacterized protein n=1 Tax=Canna indica TaxID=4628 RepID=A0AAQ3JY03_9LILI|nr:hypothetical protein Cni_G06087 [Canna indica]
MYENDESVENNHKSDEEDETIINNEELTVFTSDDANDIDYDFTETMYEDIWHHECVPLFWSAARATTQHSFNECMQKILGIHEPTYQWISQLEKEKCATFFFPDRRARPTLESAATMACAAQSMISAYSCSFPSHNRALYKPQRVKGTTRLFSSVNASSNPQDSDCNEEECAPDKEVGKVSMEWLAGEKTKVVGTFPPRSRGWTGYVEKDTAGQTNIYSVEPAVYVAENAISSGTSGTSSEGAENTLAINAGLALILIAAASSVLIQVGKNQPQVQTLEYSGPPLSYYISKFKPVQIVEAAVPPAPQTSATVEASVPPESSTSSTVETSVPPDSQISDTQEGSKPQVVPEVQVELSEIVDIQSESATNVS